MTESNDNSRQYDFKYHKELLSDDSFQVLRSKQGYEEFISSDPSLENIDYRQWVDLIDHLEQEKKQPSLKFVAPTNIMGVASSVLASKALKLGPNVNIDNIVDAGAQFVKQQVSERMSNIGINLPPGMGRDDDDGGDGGTTTENYAGGSNFNPTGLSLNLKPVDVTFKTGIVPLYRPKYFLDGQGDTAPLILKTRCIFPETPGEFPNNIFGQDVMINNYLNNKIESDWVNVISRKIKLTSFSSPLINKNYIFNYYRIMSYSLAVLYFYLSVDAHFYMKENRNEGMIALYKALSVTDLQNIRILRQTLDSVPLDPMVNQLMYHLYDNYKQSNLPGSALCKFMPIAFANSSENYFNSLNTNEVQQCLDMLKSDKFRKFQQVYVQAFPQAVETTTYSYSGVPKYDPNWLTTFTNSSVVQFSSTRQHELPTASNRTDEIFLTLHTDAPDGWIDAADSIYNSGTTKWEGGFGGPKSLILDTTTGTTSTLTLTSGYVNGTSSQLVSSYIYTKDTNNSGSEVMGFFPLDKREKYQILAGNTYKTNLTTTSVNKFQRFGTEVALPKSISDNLQSAQEFADIFYTPWKFDSGSMPDKSMTSDFEEEKSKPKRRRRRR